MKTYYGLNHTFDFSSCALTIGNFDGVHRGHSHILQRLKKEAQERSLPTVLISFEPMAKEFFAAKHKKTLPYRLSPLSDKQKLIQHSDCIDYFITIEFDNTFAEMSADDFVKLILIGKLKVKYLLIGDDFKFGYQRQGDLAFLQQYSEFKTDYCSSILCNGLRISSSTIRNAILVGDFNLAELLLGHECFLSGSVKKGQQLGRTLDCPTANIDLHHHFFPFSGVYVVDVEGLFGRKRGVANFGTNPTVTDDLSPKLEVHIFDFSGDLYDQTLSIIFKEKIREEKKFSSLQELKKQLQLDMDTAKNWIGPVKHYSNHC